MNPFLEGTNFNYACEPIYIPSKSNQNYILPTPISVNAMPNLVSCVTQIKVPFHVTGAGVNFCGLVNTVRNLETGISGLVSTSGDCVVKLGDENQNAFYISLTEGSYRFLKDWKYIACNPKGSGLYGDCNNNVTFIEVEPKDQGLDLAAEIVVDTRTVAGRWRFRIWLEKSV
jgi:hypothetical protein